MQIGQIYVKKYLSQLLRDSYTYEHKNEILNDDCAISKVSFMKYMKELLRLGSDVKIKDNNGKTIMDHLLEAQNEIDIEDKDKEFIKQCIELIKIF